jgi:CRISPR-associated protein Csx17
MHIHALEGCAPTPLAHYLKALGVLRLVAEQADPDARGWWEGERFRLATVLDEVSLVAFFAETCSPLPVFNPWGGRSGFYAGGPEKSARQALEAIEVSTQPRLEEYRTAIAVTREVLEESFHGQKPQDDA